MSWTGERRTRRYRTGYRFGNGAVLAVVRPGSPIEQWRVLARCVAADVIVIPQASNTGLTGGSTPDGEYDRPVVVVNMLRVVGIHLLDGGRQVVCLPGATLSQLEAILRPFGRESHSVIGSSYIGASVVGGVCNNSGGSLIRRGPAFTTLALYGRVEADGQLRLVNHLGIDLGDDAETILGRVETGDFAAADVAYRTDRPAADHDYAGQVRDVGADTPARFNACARTLFEASGSAGKVVLFAVRLDTFERAAEQRMFYIGTNDPAELATLRRDMLSRFGSLPVSAEYIHRDAFDIADQYGKDTFLAVRSLGAERLPQLFAAKAATDDVSARSRWLPRSIADRALQLAARLLPDHLPARMRQWRERYEHHLLLLMADDGIEEAAAYLDEHFPSPRGGYFVCTATEATQALAHRFAVAGAAVRYRAVHRNKVADIVALDIALPRSTVNWFETLPGSTDKQLIARLYYGHFFCHVFHQDYLVAAGSDPSAVEEEILRLVEARGETFPAEHNVGHLYLAPPSLAAHYRKLDPTNSLNPGVGGLSRRKLWADT